MSTKRDALKLLMTSPALVACQDFDPERHEDIQPARGTRLSNYEYEPADDRATANFEIEIITGYKLPIAVGPFHLQSALRTEDELKNDICDMAKAYLCYLMNSKTII